MSWKIALVVALLTAVITALITIPVADKLTKLHGMSDFEGKRGMAIAFLFIPAGLLGGALLGLLGAKLMHATEWIQLWKTVGVSVVMAQVLLFGTAGLSMLSIPSVPKIDGRRVALEVEIRVPLTRITERSREPDQIRMSLYASVDDNEYADIDPSRSEEQDGMLLVKAISELNSVAHQRSLSFHIEESTWLAFDLSALPGVPTTADMEWSMWKPLRDAHDTSSDPALSDVHLRYRVVLSSDR